MSKVIIKAERGDQHHLNLAMFYYSGGSTPEFVFDQLQANKFVMLIDEELIKFDGRCVQNMVRAMYSVQQKAKVNLNKINNMILDGVLKYTKTKGLHRPKGA